MAANTTPPLALLTLVREAEHAAGEATVGVIELIGRILASHAHDDRESRHEVRALGRLDALRAGLRAGTLSPDGADRACAAVRVDLLRGEAEDRAERAETDAALRLALAALVWQRHANGHLDAADATARGLPSAARRAVALRPRSGGAGPEAA